MFDLCAIGNALVDILVSEDDAFLAENQIVKGAMTLVDEDRARLLYDRAGPAVELSSGGSAANTLAGVASLGASCAFLGKVGRDSFGDVFQHDLHAQKIHFASIPAAQLSTGHCLIFVTPDAQRSMNTYLGAAVDFGPEDIDEEVVKNSAITYLEGYLFDKPAAQKAFEKAAMIAHEAGRKVSTTLSDVFCVSRHREAFWSLIRNNVDILFSNENEIKELCQTGDLGSAVDGVRHHVGKLVVTRGENGAIVTSGNETCQISACPVDRVVDTTGAGDLFAAGFFYGLIQGKEIAECGRLGAIAAAEVISHYGPRPQKSLKEIVG